MASLAEMRMAIGKTVRDVLPELNVYANVPDVANVPALVIVPTNASFAKAFNAGFDEWDFDLFLLVGIPEITQSQENLDKYITGGGPKSIREIFGNNPSMDGAVSDSIIITMDQYGGSYETAKMPHVGARLTLKVLT
jgi:hypothetical protein